MTTNEDIERHLYRAITNNRLGAASHNVPNALKALGRFKTPWSIVGVSRETWRRWNLAPNQKNAQQPSASHQAGLLAVLRRMRLPNSHEAKMRASTGIHVRAWDNYEQIERNLGKSTFGWTSDHTASVINGILNAYLISGITAAREKWLEALPADDGWAQGWLHPDSRGSSQSMDLLQVSFLEDPARAGRAGRARRR